MTLVSNGPANLVPFRFTFADATARAALSAVPADIYSLAVQLDDGSVWVLTDDAPPTWVAAAGSGLTNPMTTADDLIVGGAGGTPARLAKGGNNTVFGVDGSGTLGYKADPTGGGAGPISEQVLGSAAATISVTIPSGYKDLVLVALVRSSASADNVDLTGRFNADTGANYDTMFLSGNSAGGGNVTGTQAGTSFMLGYAPAATSPANQRTSAIISLPDYEQTTFHKNIRSDGGLKHNIATSSLFYFTAEGWWRSTAAITSLVLALSSGNFVTGSTVRLYQR